MRYDYGEARWRLTCRAGQRSLPTGSHGGGADARSTGRSGAGVGCGGSSGGLVRAVETCDHAAVASALSMLPPVYSIVDVSKQSSVRALSTTQLHISLLRTTATTSPKAKNHERATSWTWPVSGHLAAVHLLPDVTMHGLLGLFSLCAARPRICVAQQVEGTLT